MDFKTITNLGRFKDIAFVLIKFGFDDLVRRLDFPLRGRAWRIGSRRVRDTGRQAGSDVWRRVRLAVEELGPTFIKFGQILSLRPDMLPAELLEELQQLQDAVAPDPYERIGPELDRALGRPAADMFAEFDPTPVAAASLSQVYRAVLRADGREVAVKVRRPGVRAKVETDLDILAAITQRLHDGFADLRMHDLPGLVRVVRRVMLRELDFSREARYMQVARAAAQAAGPDVLVPEVVPALCSERLLVMEYVRGVKLRDYLPADPGARERLARLGMRSAIRQILVDGFFHADPHPGNILIAGPETICLLDWGMVGRLTRAERSGLVDLISAVADRNGRGMTDALLRLSVRGDDLDRPAMERDLMELLDLYAAIPLAGVDLGRLLLDVLQVLRVHRLRVPPDLVVMVKSLVTMEGSARLLHPALDVVAEAAPLVRRVALGQLRPAALWGDLRAALGRLAEVPGELSYGLHQVLTKLRRDELRIRFEHENLGPFQHTLEIIFNRLTLGIIISALIIGSSLFVVTGAEPHLFGLPVLGVLGFLGSGLLGLWLIVSIIRRRRY